MTSFPVWSCTVCGHIADHRGLGDCTACGDCDKRERDAEVRGLFRRGCPICGSRVSPREDRAEVVYKLTGAVGIAHVECYLQDTDCYDLA